MINTQAFGGIARAAAAAAAAALVIGAAVPASAARTGPDTEAKAPKQAEEPASAKEKRYCVQAPSTGTILVRRLCKTRSEWIKHDGFDPALQQQK